MCLGGCIICRCLEELSPPQSHLKCHGRAGLVSSACQVSCAERYDTRAFINRGPTGLPVFLITHHHASLVHPTTTFGIAFEHFDFRSQNTVFPTSKLFELLCFFLFVSTIWLPISCKTYGTGRVSIVYRQYDQDIVLSLLNFW
jgi:hypothetical protein